MEVARVEDSQALSQLSADPPVTAKDTEEQELEPEYLIKHPLQNEWKLWYYEGNKGRTWAENLKHITTFNTVEDFWSIYHHIKQASEIRHGCDYSIFKESITPEWEHPQNAKGGRWLIAIDRKFRHNDLDRIWLDICLCLIGEGFENNDDVCGAIVSVRGKQDKIAIWMGDASRSAAVLEVGKKIKDKLKAGPRVPVVFQLHEDAAKNASSSIKAKYTL